MNGRSAGSDGARAPRRCIAGATRHAQPGASGPQGSAGAPPICDQPAPAEGRARAPNNLPSSTTSNAPAIAAA